MSLWRLMMLWVCFLYSLFFYGNLLPTQTPLGWDRNIKHLSPPVYTTSVHDECARWVCTWLSSSTSALTLLFNFIIFKWKAVGSCCALLLSLCEVKIHFHVIDIPSLHISCLHPPYSHLLLPLWGDLLSHSLLLPITGRSGQNWLQYFHNSHLPIHFTPLYHDSSHCISTERRGVGGGGVVGWQR